MPNMEEMANESEKHEIFFVLKEFLVKETKPMNNSRRILEENYKQQLQNRRATKIREKTPQTK